MQPLPWCRIFLTLWSLVSFVATAEKEKGVTQHPNWRLLDHDKCGNSNTDRIVGGKNASLGAYPWLARIGYSGVSDEAEVNDGELSYRCGGSLINELYVVTAAHCVSNLPTNLKVSGIRLGEYNTVTDPDCVDNFCGDPVRDFEPVKIIVHKDYDNPPFKNDVAVIRLDKPVRYNELVSPICIMGHETARRNLVGETAEVAGWGIYDINDPKPSLILQTIKLPIVESTRCEKAFRSHATIGDQQICVGGVVGEDSCGGDSGGPLMKVEPSANGPPKYYFVGIVSFGAKRCGESETPAVYTKISAYLPWILNNLSP